MSFIYHNPVPGGHAMERVTDFIAFIGLASWMFPEIYDYVTSVNLWIALFIPPLSAVWLLTQLWKYWGRGK
jgi:hypothetical protein